MKESNKKHILGRYGFVVVLMMFLVIAIVAFMFRTTVIEAKAWNKKANEVWNDTTVVVPERGKLLAEDGSTLADNLIFYTVRIDWQAEGLSKDTVDKYLPALCDSLHAMAPEKSAEQWKKEINAARNKQNKSGSVGNRSYRLFKSLSRSELNRLKTFPFLNKRARHTGLYAEEHNKRHKPFRSMASRSIGALNEHMHGKSGLEMALDSLLYGTPGLSTRVPLNASTASVPVQPAIKGWDITTTINVQMQDILETELYAMLKESEASWGTAVLMEVATGEIKAISNLTWDESEQDYIEKTNNAVTGYEPGSVMKPISMMLALNQGVVTSNSQHFATGSVLTGYGRPITDPHGSASLTPVEIIERSSNIGMSKITLKRYHDKPSEFRKGLEEMGFFEPLNSGIAGENIPKVPQLRDDNGGRVSLTRQCYGYSTEIPPLYVLTMYNAIANDGKMVRPRLVKKMSREVDGERIDSVVPTSYIREQVCSPQHAQMLKEMLHAVVWGSHGTARRYLQSDKVEIAGKTGTAFTLDANGHYTAHKRLAFCGFFPYEHPKYSCVVLIRGANRGAAASSGMVLKNVALKLYARDFLSNGHISFSQGQDSVKHTSPIAAASTSAGRNAAIRKSMGVALREYKTPAPPAKGKVPNVVGLSLRDAVARLERLGINVRTRGSGYVAQQSLAPGSNITRGGSVLLTLRN